MYKQIPLVDHLRPLHKTSSRGIIAYCGILRNSTTGSFANGRRHFLYNTLIILSPGILNNPSTGVSAHGILKVPLLEFLHMIRRTSDFGILNQQYFKTTQTSNFGVLRWFFAYWVRRNSTNAVFEDPMRRNSSSRVFEDPVRSDTPPWLIGNEVNSKRSF